MKTKLLFTKQNSNALYLLLVFCLCFNFGWSQELVQNGTCDMFTVTSSLADDNSWTRNDSDNADAWDMTPNNSVIFDAEAMSGPSGATSTSPFQTVWDNDDLEDWLETYYLGAAGSLDEQPGSTSSGNGGTRGVKLYDDGSPAITGSSRRLYQKVVGLTIGNDYNFSFDSKADSGATVDSEVYILNTEIIDEVALNTDGGVAAGIRDDYMAVAPSSSWATFTSTFTASNTYVVIYVRSPGAIDGDTETFWDNISLQEDVTASAKDVLASKLNIYPNPAQDYIQIDSKDVQISSVQMYSLIGQEVISGKSLVNDRLDISSLNRGVYLLRINSESGSLTKKIIVE